LVFGLDSCGGEEDVAADLEERGGDEEKEKVSR